MEAKTDEEIFAILINTAPSHANMEERKYGFQIAECEYLPKIAEQDVRIAELEKEVERLKNESRGLMKQVDELNVDSQAGDYYLETLNKISDKYEIVLAELETLRKEKV